jgi:hypothetical protein
MHGGLIVIQPLRTETNTNFSDAVPRNPRETMPHPNVRPAGKIVYKRVFIRVTVAGMLRQATTIRIPPNVRSIPLEVDKIDPVAFIQFARLVTAQIGMRIKVDESVDPSSPIIHMIEKMVMVDRDHNLSAKPLVESPEETCRRAGVTVKGPVVQVDTEESVHFR